MLTLKCLVVILYLAPVPHWQMLFTDDCRAWQGRAAAIRNDPYDPRIVWVRVVERGA